MQRTLAFLFAFIMLLGCAFGQQRNLRLEALKKYILEKDYPEVFGKDNYRTRIEGFLDADIDNDGSREIVVLYYPHYRQSAPIVIYKISSDLKVKKVPEGLAPGPLRKVSGDYLDSHTLGMAVDFEVPGGTSHPETVLNSATTSGMNGFVIYDTFFHMDGRSGSPAIIDMRGVKLPSKDHDCGSFEFSRVKQIAAGHLREDSSNNYLAAWVGDEIYVYLIHGISNQGMLDKKLWVIQAPKGFNGFEIDNGLTYKTETETDVLTLK
jgi:hypothetical protein